ncbi:TSP1-like protein, partial [Mya arenaria]
STAAGHSGVPGGNVMSPVETEQGHVSGHVTTLPLHMVVTTVKATKIKQLRESHCRTKQLILKSCVKWFMTAVGWTTWSNWSACSVTCERQRSRSCQNPLASLMNNSCSGDAEETQTFKIVRRHRRDEV